ncbi:hypothetical protein [Clostridium paraputrificum]|uniref:Uncharacterized protein n=1 Tax=Clostridium paraputrificum TaxID=29363 RepID=A0A6N3EY81_9CLOT
METFGIHTRLCYLIKRSNGLDWVKRKQYLMKKFEFTEDVVNKVYRYPIESMLQKYNLETCLERIDKLEKKKEQEEMMNLALLSSMARKVNSIISL